MKIVHIIIGLLSAIPKIVDLVKDWLEQRKEQKRQELNERIDKARELTENAKTDADREKAAKEWADLVRNLNKP